jgi:hypothetical protein
MNQKNTQGANQFPSVAQKTKGARSFKPASLLAGALLLLSGSAMAQSFTFADNFEVVGISPSNTANAGGASSTDPTNVLASSSSWLTNGTFTTFTGTGTGSTATALSLSNSAATSQTWTLSVPLSSCIQASLTGLSFDYRATSTSYNFLSIVINGTAVYSSTISTSGSFVHVTVPAFSTTAASGPITVNFIMSNAAGHTSASGGTFRLDNISLAGTESPSATACMGAPTAGTISASGATTFCGTGSVSLNLTGSTAGCNIANQWQDSSAATAGAWVNVGAGLNFTGSVSTTTYFRVTTTCSTPSHTGSSVSPSFVVTVNPLPNAGSFGSFTNPVVIGSPITLTHSGPVNGSFSSASNAIATATQINPSTATITGIKGGITTIVYSVLDGATLCSNSITTQVNVVWPNTLALYAGATGSDVTVIPVVNDNVNTLLATAFGSTTPCTTGGLSGLTVNVAVTAFDSAAGPHVGYKVYPAAHKVLNVSRIHATTRESGSGPTQARIAYRYWSQGVYSGWKYDAADVAQDVTGGCGTSANSWDFNTGVVAAPDPTVNGITDSLEVAVFPYHPAASGGTFQLNTLEVYGIVTDSMACSLSSISGADSALPTAAHICDSGSRFLNYNLGTGGVAGIGISYQWQVSTASATTGFSNVTGATGTGYEVVFPSGTATPVTEYFRVKVLCAATGDSAFSVADTVTLTATPTAAITSIPHYLHIEGSSVTLAGMPTTPGHGWWSSNDTSSTSVDSASGSATAHIQGVSIITYHYTDNGCTATAKDTIRAIHDNTKTIYLGLGGNSTNVDQTSDVTAGPVTILPGLIVGTSCSNGGVSGLKVTATGTAPDQTQGVIYEVTTTSTFGFDLTDIYATTRVTNTASDLVYQIGYSIDGISYIFPDPTLNPTDVDDCGYGTEEGHLAGQFVTIDAGDPLYIGVFPFYPTGTLPVPNTGLFQVNSLSVIGDASPFLRPAAPTGVNNVATAAAVQLFPNPATNVLNVVAAQNVNVAILSIDGKKLIEQKNAKNINVSSLVAGMYLVQVSDANNVLIQTTKFVKK